MQYLHTLHINFAQGGEHWRLLVGGSKNEFVSWPKSLSTGCSLISLRSNPFSKIFTFTYENQKVSFFFEEPHFWVKFHGHLALSSWVSYHLWCMRIICKILFLILEVLDPTLGQHLPGLNWAQSSWYLIITCPFCLILVEIFTKDFCMCKLWTHYLVLLSHSWMKWLD